MFDYFMVSQIARVPVRRATMPGLQFNYFYILARLHGRAGSIEHIGKTTAFHRPAPSVAIAFELRTQSIRALA